MLFARAIWTCRSGGRPRIPDRPRGNATPSAVARRASRQIRVRGNEAVSPSPRLPNMSANALHARRVPRVAGNGEPGGFDGEDTSTPATAVPAGLDSASAPSPPPPRRRFLAVLNESTKFLVSGAAAATLALRPDVAVVWCLIGSVVNSALGKALKRLLNEKRPEGAAKADPGMPSSHALSLAYLSTYAAAALALRGGGDGGKILLTKFGTTLLEPWPVPAWAVAPGCAALVSMGVFLTWLRVELGYHTKPQVGVGYALGAATASLWLAVGELLVVPAATRDANVARALYGACLVTSALFAKVAVRWVDEIRLVRKGGKAKAR